MVASLYSADEEKKVIWVYLEHMGGALEAVSLELLAKGRQMADEIGWDLHGLLLGRDVVPLAAQAYEHAADQVWLVENPLLERFTVEAHTHAAFEAIMMGKPSVLLFGATPDGRDLAARLAVRLRTGLNADCTGLYMDAEDDLLVSEVSGFGGGVLALIEMRHHRPQLATVRTGVFEPGKAWPGRVGRLVRVPVVLSKDMLHTCLIERAVGERIDLARAPFLIAGGRGVEGDFTMLEELAELLGGVVGATRPPVDEGHIERERQIGQTGVVCSPKVAICCGISGAFHFVVGVEKAGLVIAINSDPDAPIFEFADYGIVGDAHQVVSELIAALRAEREVSFA